VTGAFNLRTKNMIHEKGPIGQNSHSKSQPNAATPGAAEPNTDLAVGFLNARPAQYRHDLAAIDPVSGRIEAATFTAVQGGKEPWHNARRWIDARQGKVNLYYSVNAAKPDAPLNQRLNKERVGTLHAIVADLDPSKVKGGEASGENFRKERERLLKVVRAAADDPKGAPTLIIDSGGGFQLIWQLIPVLPPTPENVELAEGIGRSIQQRFGGDAVWNIDRIMRLPGTINVPSPDKRLQGRKPAAATVLLDESQKGGKPFTIEQLAEWAPPVAAGTKPRARAAGTPAAVPRAAARHPSINMDLVRVANTYDELPAALRKKFETLCDADPVVRELWDGKPAPRQSDESGSGYAFALARPLKAAGNFTINEFGQLLWVYPDGPTDQGKIDARYIVRAWDNAPAQPWDEPANLWADASKPPELPEGIVPEIVERLARDAGRRLGVEPGAVAAALVTTLGALIPAGNELQLRQHDTNWTVRPILWTSLIGEPGTNKTATTSYAIEPVKYVEHRWRVDYAKSKRNEEAQKAAGALFEAAGPAVQSADDLFKVEDVGGRVFQRERTRTEEPAQATEMWKESWRRTVGLRTRLARSFLARLHWLPCLPPFLQRGQPLFGLSDKLPQARLNG
jgi:hypothetical protein